VSVAACVAARHACSTIDLRQGQSQISTAPPPLAASALVRLRISASDEETFWSSKPASEVGRPHQLIRAVGSGHDIGILSLGEHRELSKVVPHGFTANAQMSTAKSRGRFRTIVKMRQIQEIEEAFLRGNGARSSEPGPTGTRAV
jgi:hypothetical protein